MCPIWLPIFLSYLCWTRIGCCRNRSWHDFYIISIWYWIRQDSNPRPFYSESSSLPTRPDFCLTSMFVHVPVPPEKPLIRDRHGQELLMYDIGPYEIEQDLILECEVSGGEYVVNVAVVVDVRHRQIFLTLTQSYKTYKLLSVILQW